MVYSLNPLHGIFLQFSGSNPSVISEFYHLTALSHSNNEQAIQNARQLTLITKTYGFNSLSEVVCPYENIT